MCISFVLLLSPSTCVFCIFYIHNSYHSSLFSQTQRSPHVFYRHDLINQLQHNHALVTLVAENLSAYMETMRQFSKGTSISHQKWYRVVVWMFICLTGLMHALTEEQAEFDPQTVRPGSRYSHVQEVQERLNFLRYVTMMSILD